MLRKIILATGSPFLVQIKDDLREDAFGAHRESLSLDGQQASAFNVH